MREQSDSNPKCPGETNCQDWAAAYGETQQEKEENACFGCRLFPTKYSNSDDWIEEIVNFVERLRMEQRAGRKIKLSKIEPLIWEGLVMWHREEFQVENEYRIHTRLLIESAFQPKF